MLDEDIEPLQTMLKLNEGYETTFYLDSDNPANPTIGVGHEVPTVSMAQELPLLLVASGAPATPTEIANGYYALKAMAPRTDGKLRRYLGLFLESADIDALLMADLRTFDTYLHATFPEFDSYPQPARLAAFDIVFNVGSLSDFPLLRAAILAEDWATAATQCHRVGVSAARNIETQNSFLAAANS
jgi:GH24 family phage-related lysozyme (muramidase)